MILKLRENISLTCIKPHLKSRFSIITLYRHFVLTRRTMVPARPSFRRLDLAPMQCLLRGKMIPYSLDRAPRRLRWKLGIAVMAGAHQEGPYSRYEQTRLLLHVGHSASVVIISHWGWVRAWWGKQTIVLEEILHPVVWIVRSIDCWYGLQNRLQITHAFNAPSLWDI